jgi:hypothetical protein
MAFVTVAMFQSILIIVRGIIVAKKIKTLQNVVYLDLNVVLVVLAFTVWVFLSSLFFMHLYFICTNQTTNEHFKNMESSLW